MDQSIAVVEENHRRNETMASTSKPVGSLVHINSIAIDISCAVEAIEEPPVHEHFSIRGFVSGVRKKDWKTCLPFDSENDEILMDNLPPLSIPKSRWWQCSHCVPHIANKENATRETLLKTTNDPCPSSCPYINGEQDALFLPNVQRTTGDGHVPREDDSSQSNNKVINSSVRSNEKHKATTGSTEKPDAMDDEGQNARTSVAEGSPLQIQEEMYQKTAAAASDAVHANGVDNASSGSEDSFNVAAYRKKRKLRSLVDIMYEEKNSTTGEQSRNLKSATSSGTQAKSTDAEADLDAECNLDTGRSTKPQKRKSEERTVSEMTSPAKKQKGVVQENTEKTCRRFQVSDSESEWNASAHLDVRQNAKILQAKPKKKTRQAHVENKTTSFALQKNNIASSGSDSGFITMGTEKGQGLTGFPSEKQVDRISYLSKGKRPVVEGDHSPNFVAPLGKSVVDDRNIQRGVALDLSLNSCADRERNADGHMFFRRPSSIPDLNESFIEKTIQGKQLPMVSEKRSSVPSRTSSEMLPSCSRDMARETERNPGIPQSQTVQNINTTVESGGVSDDIPMEIVELLARNQRDRALGNARQQQIPREPFHSSSMQRSPVYLDGHPSSFNFPPRSTAAFNEMGINRGIPAKSSGNFDHSHFRLFNSLTPNRQRKMPFPSRNTIGPPRLVEGMDRSDLLWPPRSKNGPFHLSAPQNCSIPNSSLNVQPTFQDHCYKGKPINDFKGKGKIGSGHKSLDAYSNDTIPAMQLLSLMDRGIVSGSSFKVGKNNFIDKPFSPCSHHPRLNGNENPSSPFFNASSFSQSSHGKNFPGLLNGVCFPSESLKKPYLREPIFAGQQEVGQQSRGIQFNNPAQAVTIPPLRENLQLGLCTLNRNPADFSSPEANNVFTIAAKDLKSRKRTTLKEKPPQFRTMENQKRQRAKKDTPGKDLPRK